MKKLPQKVQLLFKEIMEEFKKQISAKGMQLTQEDLQTILIALKNKYEVRVKGNFLESISPKSGL